MLCRRSRGAGSVNPRLATIALGCSLSACGLISKDEVNRVTGPTGAVDAVLVEKNAGATVDFAYEAYLVRKGGSPWQGTRVATWYGAIRNQQAYGVNLKWRDSSNLELEYLSAKAQELEHAVVSVAGLDVRVALRSGISDPKAPAGGMLYNLEGQSHE